MGFVMFYLVKYHDIFHSAGVCNHKNKLSVEVGKGFFQRFFFKPLMPINVGTHLWEMWGPGARVS